MKRLLLFLLLVANNCFAQITIVAKAGNSGNGNTVAIPSTNTTDAKFIMVTVQVFAGVATGALIDNKSNTYTLLRTDQVTGTVANLVYYCANPTVGTGHTWSYNKTGSFPAMNVIALGNVPTSSPIDQQNGSFTASAASVQPGSVTAGQTNEIVITSICTTSPGTTPTINSGFTISSSVAFGAGVNQCGVMAYLIQTTASAINPTWSWTTSTASAATSIVTVKANVSNGGFFIITP